MGKTTMWNRIVWIIAAGLCWVHVAVAQQPAASKDRIAEANLEQVMSGPDIDALEGQAFDVLLKNGKSESGATLKSIIRDKKQKDRIRTLDLTLSGGKKSRKLPVDQVFQLEREGQAYAVAPLPSQRSFVLIDTVKRDAAIAKTLEKSGYQLWPAIPLDDQEKYVGEEKEFLEKVKAHFPSMSMQLVETPHFLFLSDMPTAQINAALKQLEKMEETLGQLLGAAPGKNVWRGKCVVIVFVERKQALEFEETLIKSTAEELKPPPSASNQIQGFCHLFYSDLKDAGRVVIAGTRGAKPEILGAWLIREAALGYLFRHRSNQTGFDWLNAGIGDWITTVIIPSNQSVPVAQRAAVQKLRETTTLGPEFFEMTNEMQPEEYGIASGMVQMLIENHPVQFQLFFNGIKEGWNADQENGMGFGSGNLMRAYGMTYADLVSAYGRAIGVPDLLQEE